jgi:EAL domain-containing protein (putative c-di-GMP-specific phosphodiesterase class I)/FixJ family two-component response regulator
VPGSLDHIRSAIVIDDDPLQRKVAAAALHHIGFTEVFEAGDGLDALEALAVPGRRIDFALCDLDMAGMDGIQMLSRLAREHPGMPVVLLSSQEESIITAVGTMAAGAGLQVTGTMQKPLDRARLAEYARSVDQTSRLALDAPSHDAMSVPDLQRALDERRIVPHFQPKVDIRSGRACGAEALARWHHPRLGIIPPSRFIATAEASGLITELTRQILEQSLAAAALWQRRSIDLCVSVNLTAGFLERDATTEEILAIARRHGVAPEKVVLEVTESMAAQDLPAMVGHLARLRMRGFGLSIDDFGTGYASLQQLSQVPFTEMKIDRSFVVGARTQPHLRTILESSLQLGRRLGMKTTAEGVETAADLERVRAMGCDIAQGYHFSPPLPNAQFLAWVERFERERQRPAGGVLEALRPA